MKDRFAKNDNGVVKLAKSTDGGITKIEDKTIFITLTILKLG